MRAPDIIVALLASTIVESRRALIPRAAPDCSQLTAQVSNLEKHIVHYTYFCQNYLKSPQDTSPLPALTASVMTDSCYCALTQAGVTIPAGNSQPPVVATSLSCVSTYQTNVNNEFSYPKAFCLYMQSLDRSYPPISGLTVTQVLQACLCIAPPAQTTTMIKATTTTKAVTSSKTTATTKFTTTTTTAKPTTTIIKSVTSTTKPTTTTIKPTTTTRTTTKSTTTTSKSTITTTVKPTTTTTTTKPTTTMTKSKTTTKQASTTTKPTTTTMATPSTTPSTTTSSGITTTTKTSSTITTSKPSTTTSHTTTAVITSTTTSARTSTTTTTTTRTTATTITTISKPTTTTIISTTISPRITTTTIPAYDSNGCPNTYATVTYTASNPHASANSNWQVTFARPTWSLGSYALGATTITRTPCINCAFTDAVTMCASRAAALQTSRAVAMGIAYVLHSTQWECDLWYDDGATASGNSGIGCYAIYSEVAYGQIAAPSTTTTTTTTTTSTTTTTTTTTATTATTTTTTAMMTTTTTTPAYDSNGCPNAYATVTYTAYNTPASHSYAVTFTRAPSWTSGVFGFPVSSTITRSPGVNSAYTNVATNCASLAAARQTDSSGAVGMIISYGSRANNWECDLYYANATFGPAQNTGVNCFAIWSEVGYGPV
ncbi:hypothetical protein K461DRAFT_319824 [Myriangium duriaei CBS 260.36]|uniref:Uncharacterized protein n=1 Tax=Myriangium duriaei CBS 260.36 TaxID=1168546 RepID=A0A9P4J4R8_9PEZI|nr:hypothetical protein K461DRAFT_319824 [Myriangium duriaei CBS 260.36]